jgi:hypothetical protein
MTKFAIASYEFMTDESHKCTVQHLFFECQTQFLVICLFYYLNTIRLVFRVYNTAHLRDICLLINSIDILFYYALKVRQHLRRVEMLANSHLVAKLL